MYTNATHTTLKNAADALTELFPKTDVKPAYSPEFIRKGKQTRKFLKLKMAQRVAMATLHGSIDKAIESIPVC